jgi:hypothetical protein
LNRQSKNCLYCGAVLPENLLFSKEEIEMQNRKLEEKSREDRARQKTRADINWFNQAR